MINKVLSLVILFVLLSFCCLAEAKNIKMRNDKELLSNSKPAYVPSELLVKYKPVADTAAIKHFHDRRNITVLKKMKRANLRHVKLPPDLNVEETVKLYKSDPNVEYAEPNYYVYAETTTPNDTDFPELWGLHNTGQTVNGSTGTADADIDAPEAWDICTGSSDVIIAVIDSGVAYDHPELAPNIWTNTGEVADNGVDDDGNGYVDDTQGWDFVGDDNDPMDYGGHGTHVAGTIAGVSNNTRGITGMMWDAQIMPLRFLDMFGNGSTSDAILAIDYAIDNGAKVLNNSWGGGNYSQFLKEAIERAETAGALFIASAGNEGDDNDSTPHYPSNYDVDNIITVAATDQNDNLASFSNYGATSVDVAAPGTNIYSTIPAREVIFSDDFDDGNIDPWITDGTDNTWDVTIKAFNSASYSLTDSPHANYLNNTDSWAGSPVIDLSEKKGCKWFYYMNLDVEYYYDALFIETSTDNTTWTYLTGWTGSTGGYFYQFEEDLTPYDGTPTMYVRFRLDSDLSITDDGAYIDDVELTCYSSDYSADTQYDHFNGTSMATPHVSGLAGLIWSYRPSLTYSQVKDYILNGVDIVSDLSGKIVTNGRVNAYTSLTAVSDGDDDGMPDEWEEANGLDHSVNDAWEDPDGDGLNNLGEYQYDTDPNNPDTDDDGMPDGWEVSNGLDPLADDTAGDLDGDGWSNFDEYTYSTNPNDYTLVPVPPEVEEVIPHDGAGIGDDDSYLPNNTSFAVLIVDSNGIDITDTASIMFTIDDSENDGYEIDLDSGIRVTKLYANEDDTAVTRLWAVYHRAEDEAQGNVYPYDQQVNITVNANDNTGLLMGHRTYAFKIATETEHSDVLFNSPDTETVESDDPVLDDQDYTYDSGIEVTGGDLEGAKIVYDSNEVVQPTLGPTNDLPPFDEDGVDAVGVPMNLQPPTVFTTPVKIFIPCPGHTDVSSLSIYLYNGTAWVPACNTAGDLLPDGEDWIVPGSRVNHQGTSPPTVEIKVYHFTGVQAAASTSSASATPSGGGGGGGGGCFIATAAFGSYISPHVKILRDFRDACLLTNRAGQGFVRLYYKYSPPVADFITEHGSLKATVRCGLYPLVGLSYVTLHTTSTQQALIAFGLVFAFSGIVMVRRRVKRRDF